MTWENHEPDGLVRGGMFELCYTLGTQCRVCGSYPPDWWMILHSGGGIETACEYCMRWYWAALAKQ